MVAKDNVNAMDMEASLWNRRLSYISEKGMNYLIKKDMLPGLKNANLEKCSYCMVGKQTRMSFKKHPPSRKSELLDVCGPLKVKSFGGANMITRELLRGKFEACCEIVSLTVTST